MDLLARVSQYFQNCFGEYMCNFGIKGEVINVAWRISRTHTLCSGV